MSEVCERCGSADENEHAPGCPGSELRSGANDRGVRLVEMDDEMIAFALENCDANVRLAVSMLQSMVDDETSERRESEKIVKLIENFNKMKQALERAR